MTHQFTTIPDFLIEHERMNLEIGDFVKKNGWALSTYKIDTINSDVT
tara:strand:+ start:479 stop:619 length:141 start_codon:yes stop_codon:yes gene_type:complete